MWHGTVWYCWHGSVRLVEARCEKVRYGMAGEARFGGVRCVTAGYCGAVRGVDWFGRHGAERLVEASRFVLRIGKAGYKRRYNYLWSTSGKMRHG